QVSEFTFAYNTAKHDATEFSPAYLNYGREILPPLSIRARADRGKDEVYDPHQAAKTLEDTIELVKVNLAQAYGKQAKYYNRKRGSWQPALGDLVSKREHHLSSAIDHFSAKLAEKYATAFTVTKIVGPSVYEVSKEG
ncbi:GSCOCG00011540001-RA-CDS, partial [Cotesia congregata]